MKSIKKFPFWGIDRTLSKSTYLSWDEKSSLNAAICYLLQWTGKSLL